MKNWKYINGAEVGNATIKFYGETIDLTKKSESNLKEILEELQPYSCIQECIFSR